MKKTLTIFALILVLTTSLISGTLAAYTSRIDNLAEGSVVAKEFILMENGTDSFAQNVKIAPGETVEWQYSVKNHDGAIVSETAMDLDFNIQVIAADGKSMITPLVFTVRDSSGQTVGTITSGGVIEFSDEFSLAAEGQQKHYTVSVNWPSNDNEDIQYAGSDFGTAVKVSVTGTQK